jgi:catechol 2,3-dioxygenase-like lactoylglutathione lyase family enzyme
MARIELVGWNHVGIRVKDLARSVEFYRHLGFAKIWYSDHHEVAGLRNAAGIELNLIVNSDDDNGGKNVLMDVAAKYPGYTHASFRVASIDQTARVLADDGIAIAEGPVNLGGEIALFVRDPDGNVVELAELVG